MPMAPLRPCARAGCRNLVKKGHCPECERDASRLYDARPDRVEDHRFYASRAWRRVRAERLRLNPICQDSDDGKPCTRPATEVDHTIPRSERPDLELDLGNTNSKCKPHHSRKTMGEQRRKRA